jgi:UPF0755 protein
VAESTRGGHPSQVGAALRKIIRTVLLVLLATIAVSAALAYVAVGFNEPVDGDVDTAVVFTVHPGETLSAIAARLESEGLIRSRRFLRFVSLVKRTQREFQVGSFLISLDMSTLAVHDLLVSGRELLVRVTIPEGWTTRQIGTRLESLGITDAGEFIAAASAGELLEDFEIPAASAEGYLFPDTYLFPRDFPAERVVRVLIERFFREIGALLEGLPPKSAVERHERVVLASIIEREYRADDEAKLMASVFYNRMKIGMPLQSCTTVAFVMTEELGLEYPETLTYADLEIPSAYNTYWTSGLPPGPISNPGVTALDAAIRPAESDYLYFVLRDPDAGRHEFTRSYDEHLSAKSLYLKRS